MASKASSSVSKRQTATVERLRQVDSTLSVEQVEDVILVSFTPRWEKGRVTGGVYRENANPTRLTHAVTTDGRIHGWGFGPVKVTLPEDAAAMITTAEDMAPILKARLEARKPVKVENEVEVTPEVEVETPKAAAAKKTAAKKTTTRQRSGVVVSK